MNTPSEYRAAARRLLDALPAQLPRQAERVADAAVRALWDSGLLPRGPLSSSDAFVAGRDALTALAHHLDRTTAGGQGAGRLLLLVTADRGDFAPYPRLYGEEARVRDAAAALLTFLEWHSDEPDHVLAVALRFHAEQAARAAVTVTLGTDDEATELHVTLQNWSGPSARAVCGTTLTRHVVVKSGGLTECGGCFGYAPIVPVPVLTGPEHDAWTAYLSGRPGATS